MRRVASLDELIGEEPHRMAALGSVAAFAGATAVAAGQVELWALAGAGAFAAAAQLVQSARGRRRRDTLARFFGAREVVVTPGTWTSPDGRRRLRAVLGDALVRWEKLDPSTGETLASFRVNGLVAPPPPRPAEVLDAQVAQVQGRGREPRCFAGLPRAFGGRSVRALEPSWVVLEVRRDAVILERRDARGRSVGDTSHPDRDAAMRQLERELGAAVSPFRDASDVRLEPGRAPAGWDAGRRSRVPL